MENQYSKAKNKTVIVDNYDSFVYNLVHIVNEFLDSEVDVIRNDEFEMEELNKYDYIILSPGPGIPEEAGSLKKVIEVYGSTKKILGVCLGLQAIGEVYGAQLKNLSRVFHGVKSQMMLTENTSLIFENVPKAFDAGRYHSWVIDTKSDLSNLIVTCVDSAGEIMAIEHKDYRIYAVQFHPESIMTDNGKTMIANFLKS
jgi:anthranilate synthase component II